MSIVEYSHPIVLTQDEKSRLRAAARKHTSPYCDVMRARVLLLAADGLSDRRIAEQLELPPRIVSKWRAKFQEQRPAD